MIVGMKYYQQVNGNIIKYRVVDERKKDNERFFKLVNEDTEKHITVSLNDLKNNYIMLVNDAYLNIFEAGLNDGSKDLFVCVNKRGETEPAIICRQSYLNDSPEFILGNKIRVGICLDTATSSKEEVLALMDFKEIRSAGSVALYVDDTLDSMLSVIPRDTLRIFNKVLEDIRNTTLKGNMFEHVTTRIGSLLEYNNFITHYRAIFNILQLSFLIDIGASSHNDDGTYKLNDKQQKKLEDILGQYIHIDTVIKYDKDIDVSKIVNYNHIMVSDERGIIYLIAYTVISEYPKGVDPDIVNAFGKVL